MNMSGDGSVNEGEIWVLNYIKERLGNNGSLVVFDVGANNGHYSAEVIKRFGQNLRLYAFEPARETHGLLTKCLSSHDNAECLNFGLSDHEASTTLYSFASQSGLSSVYDRSLFNQPGSNGNHYNKRKEDIQLRTLDSFCRERKIERISLLKIDVEGHELKVLQGAAGLIESGAIDFIQFEFGGTNVDSRIFLRDFFEVLQPNYSLHRILRNGLWSIEPYAERDEIFLLSNYLAVSRTLAPMPKD